MSLIPQPKSKFLAPISKEEMAQRLEDQPLVDKLFRRTFAVLVPAAYLYSEEDFARGVPVTLDKDRDRMAANELELAWLPIAPEDDKPRANILEFFEQDIPCQFRYENDVVSVYNILMQHFTAMAHYLNDEPLMGKEKRDRIMQDLDRFDKLAAKLHPSAHQLLPKHLGYNSVEARLRQVLKPRMGTIALDALSPATNEPPEYRKFTHGINKQLLKGNKRWE